MPDSPKAYDPSYADAVTAHSIRQMAGTPSSDDKHHPPPSRRWRAWLEWLNGTDPGLMRLATAAEVVFAVGVVIVAEWAFVRGTGALQVPVPAKAPPAVEAKLWAGQPRPHGGRDAGRRAHPVAQRFRHGHVRHGAQAAHRAAVPRATAARPVGPGPRRARPAAVAGVAGGRAGGRHLLPPLRPAGRQRRHVRVHGRLPRLPHAGTTSPSASSAGSRPRSGWPWS